MGKHHRKLYFSARALRVSMVLIVLFSLATVLLFTFVVKEVGGFLESRGFNIRGNVLALVIVIVGYAVIVFGLAYFFSYRFIGPFERLKTDMAIVLDGFYHRRLSTRDKDDIYVRSFVDEVNMMLDEFESLCRSREELRDIVTKDLKKIIALLDNESSVSEQTRQAMLDLNKKLEILFEKSCKPCKSGQS